MASTSAVLEVLKPDGAKAGTLRISPLDGARAAPLWDHGDDAQGSDALERVQLVEGSEYVYEFDLETSGAIRTDREEIFQRDDISGKRGRLRPAEHVGLLPVTVFVDEDPVGLSSLEVRSRKLDYVSHYRWMLRDIATTATALLSERFAPTQAHFEPKPTDDVTTLYQRFAFLYVFITGPQFDATLAQVLSRPHRAWVDIQEVRRPSMGLKADSALLRRLVQPGPKQRWDAPEGHPLTHLPTSVRSSRSEETVDTAENRFVRFALEHWRTVVDAVRAAAKTWPETPSRRRALLETAETLDVLDAALGQELFREVGVLRRFPASSSVLHHREGYRELFFAYLQGEIASGLTWEGGEDVFGAGLRDVATLYEFWTFLQLVEVVRDLCSQHDMSQLVEMSKDKMSLNLKRSRSVVVQGRLNRLGRDLEVSLFFNKSFSPRHKGPLDGSWSALLRPDCSIRVTLSPGTGTPTDVVWLHFDAKYRIEKLREVFGGPIESEEDELEELARQGASDTQGGYKVADLLKMHAYLAAIRRASGAYVMYPGTEAKTFERYQEILPGLGAFPLSPTESGIAMGASSIAMFLDSACTHLANQATQEERSRFWNRIVFEGSPTPSKIQQVAAFLKRPPADTQVLVTPLLSSDEEERIRTDRLFVIPKTIVQESQIPLEGLGATVLLVRGLEGVTAWTLEPFRLQFLGDRQDLGGGEGVRDGRTLALELFDGPFPFGSANFPTGSERDLLAGSLGDFLTSTS